ncbi:MAG: PH domain-containing protein [Deferribacteres bacterium]|nr:PH domain-containing protein [Deferribacteres bacterium]
MYYYRLYAVAIAVFMPLVRSDYNVEGAVVLVTVFFVAAIFRSRWYFSVTTDRVITQVGLIGRNTKEIRLRHIRTINTSQGPLERILGIGTTIFISAADGEAAVVFKGIRDPQGVKEMIRTLQGV